MDVRRTLVIAILVAIAVLVGLVVTAFALRYKARTDAKKYLGFVAPLRVNTAHNVVAADLRSAGIPMEQSGDCNQGCIMTFHVDDRSLWKLHLAPPVGFNGRLDFRNGALVYKFTSMGQDIMVWSASVSEGTPGLSVEPLQSSSLHANQNSSGKRRQIFVHLLPSDFSDFRTRAYAFNIGCIGSLKPCEAEDYLPTRELERLSGATGNSQVEDAHRVAHNAQ
ncbi:MAG TPA: hypothetical protein VJ731_07665 [Terriglobales bacterium]|nr:hypothetical protein [Terriglobales bacterium]